MHCHCRSAAGRAELKAEQALLSIVRVSSAQALEASAAD